MLDRRNKYKKQIFSKFNSIKKEQQKKKPVTKQT